MMKEYYISPEVKLVSFVCTERLASNAIDFDDLLSGNAGTPVTPSASGDIEIDLTA